MVHAAKEHIIKVLETVAGCTTVSSIIYDEVFQGGRGKIEYREIRAQYELLQNDESVIVKEIPIDENNTVTVYLKQYGQQDESTPLAIPVIR